MKTPTLTVLSQFVFVNMTFKNRIRKNIPVEITRWYSTPQTTPEHHLGVKQFLQRKTRIKRSSKKREINTYVQLEILYQKPVVNSTRQLHYLIH